MEPVLPSAAARRDRPIAGRARARRDWPPRSGWRTLAIDDGGDADDAPRRGCRDRRSTSTLAGVDDRSFVVVATQGHYDEDALERALATPGGATSGWSPRRSAPTPCSATCATGASPTSSSRGCTRRPGSTSGTSRARRSRWRSWRSSCSCGPPATLDARRGPRRPRRHEAIDPVCGMTVDVAGARYRTVARRSHDLLLLRGVPGAVRGRTRRRFEQASSRHRRGRALDWVSCAC